ncbi:MAG: Sec-independent protein translocase protein TatB [Halioglobus sp.]
MFDIGFAELLIIGIVGLLVIGPERLPGTIRTVSVWVNKFRRSFNDIRDEVRQELHNDEVMQELKKTGEQLKDDVTNASDQLNELVDDAGTMNTSAPQSPADDTDNGVSEVGTEKPPL